MFIHKMSSWLQRFKVVHAWKSTQLSIYMETASIKNPKHHVMDFLSNNTTLRIGMKLELQKVAMIIS